MMLCLQHGTARILLSGTCPNPAKSMAGAGFAINGRMPDLPESEPKFGTSLVCTNNNHAVSCWRDMLLYVLLILSQHFILIENVSQSKHPVKCNSITNYMS